MSTTTETSTTMTACPTWCSGEHVDDMWHETTLARVEGPLAGRGHEVQLVRAIDPVNDDGAGPWLLVLIRGNDTSYRKGEPWTVDELLDVSAMFARAAASLAGVSS